MFTRGGRSWSRFGFGAVSPPGVGLQESEADAPAVSVATIEPEAVRAEPEIDRSPITAALAALAECHPQNEALRQLRGELAGELAEFQVRFDAFLEAVAAENPKRWSAELETLQEECRQQRTVVTGLNEKLIGERVNLENARKRNAAARSQLITAQESIPSPDSWPTQKQIAKAHERVRSARTEVADAQREEAAAYQWHNEVALQVQTAENKLRDLAIQEKRLRLQLGGEPYRDPEFGLSVRS